MSDEDIEKDVNFKYFGMGVYWTLAIIILIVAIYWLVFAQPWLSGVSYNMQLDEAALRHCGITPTNDYQAMWQQIARLPILIGQ